MAARRGKSQAKRSGSGPVPGWVWLLVGLLGGLVIAGVFLLRERLPGADAPQPQPAVPAGAAPAEEVAPEPRRTSFNFYDMLPNNEVVVTDVDATVRAEAAQPAAQRAAVRYALQAGAFRTSADAEAVKARIALAGMTARVETGEAGGGTVYRVRLGPYPSAAELEAARAQLAMNGIEAVATRVE